MSGIISGLAGAGGAASTAGNYYQGAANDIVNATGSPAAATFGKEQMAALRPQFQQLIDQASAQAAAQGITGSGSNRANLGNVTAQDSATLAGAEAPLYQQALGQYGNIIGNMPGAQLGAYNNAIQDFYSGLNSAGSLAGDFLGIPGLGGGGGTPADTPGGQGYYSGGQLVTQGGDPYLP